MNRTIDEEYRFRLFMKSYYVHDGNLWYIENDDPDNYQENLIGPTDGDYVKVWKTLETRDWPKVQAWGEVNV